MRKQTKRVALMGLLFALALILNFVEQTLPALPIAVPGVKLGLSNIVTMYALVFLDFGSALTITVLKSMSVMFMRGAVAAFLSLGGGVVSLMVMALFYYILVRPGGNSRVRLVSLGIMGGIFHNVGQISVSCIILKTTAAFAYLPVLLVSGVVMGFLTGTTLAMVYPYFLQHNK